MNAQLVTLHVWRVPAGALPRALWRMASDRGALRRTPGIRFAKLLGTARGFGPAEVDPTRWAALVAWSDPAPSTTAGFDATPVGRAWRALSTSYCRLELTPLASSGTWAGQRPFDVPARTAGNGMVLALTRARLRPSRAVTFWRASAGVAPAVRGAAGLLATFGIGEAPIGWQGTVSLWRDAGDLVEFAYRHPDHRKAIEQTRTRRWYAEELFARFAVLDVAGDRSVIGWTADTDEAQDQSQDQNHERTSL